MGDIIHHPEVRDIVRALDPIAETVPVKNAHWITLPDGSSYYGSHGAEWCRDCARPMIRHLRRKDRRHRRDYVLDGGWCSEHETPPHCAGCGVKLECTLTSYGALEELDHFRDNPPSPAFPHTIYEVREMVQAVEYIDVRYDEFALEAITIGRTLADAIIKDSQP
jgi:hypothetical protein